MTLKIEKDADAGSTIIRFIGRIESEHVEELRAQIIASGSTVAFDLDEVSLVDVEVVRFLGACEAQGVRVLRCSPYIRQWISRERNEETQG